MMWRIIILVAAIFSIFHLMVVRAQNSAPVLSSDRLAVVGARGAQLHHVLTQQPLGQLSPGALVTVKARSEDGQLLFVQTETQQSGWVATDELLVIDVSGLPAMTPPQLDVDQLPITLTQMLPQTLTQVLSPTLFQTLTGANILVPTAVPGGVIDTLPSGVTASVTLQSGRLNLRSGPGIAYPTVGKANVDSRWTIVGRTAAGDWVQVRSSDSQEVLWAAATYLQIEGNVETVPTITDLPAPPQAPAPVRILQPTPEAGNLTSATSQPAPSVTTTLVTTAPVVKSGKTGLSGTLVFQDRIGGTIYLYDLDRDTLRPLTGGIDPALSPDGRQVAFTRDGGGNGLYVINSDGSDERVIYKDWPLLRAPKWSPDGRYLIFSRSNGFDDCRAVRGSVCLPDSAILEALPPELQLDMEVNKLVRGIPNQRAYHTTLSRISPAGTDYRDIPSLDFAAAPDWNEAGIVYQSNAGIQRTADEADARSTQVAHDPLLGYFHDPAWQPGGGRIAFHRKQGSHWQIYAVNPDGSSLTALTRPVTALVDELPSNVSPTWSPDGRHILYVSNRNSIESAGAWHFWVMNADGSDQRLLPIDIVLEYTFSSEQMVSWGPSTQ
jgi:dipeptidyl aminopeptidase/acylaminoacyl peptidase